MTNFDNWNLNKQLFKQISNSEYEKLLKGELFSFYKINESAAAGSYYYGIETNDDAVVMAIDVGCSDKIKFELFEDSDFTGGTEVVLLNKNRNYDVTLDTKFYMTPTVNAEGSLIAQTIEGTTINGRIGNSVGLQTTNTFLLKKNTKYLIKLTTYATADISIVINFFKVY